MNGEKIDMKQRREDGLKLFNEAILPVPKNAVSTNVIKTKACLKVINVILDVPEIARLLLIKSMYIKNA